MDSQTPILLPDVASDSKVRANAFSVNATTSLLAFPFPAIKPVGVLAAFCCRKGHQDQLAEQILTLRNIGELTGAALGNVASRQILERQLESGTEQIAQVLRQHAQELQRRDMARQ
jgi:hypothetical protein